MESQLNINEFRNRIKINTKIGYPKVKLSPFGFLTMFGENSKSFYGLYDDSSFMLTMNSILPTFYIIKGKYKTLNRNVDVKYTIEPRNKFQLIWMKMFPIFSILVWNLFLFMEAEKPPTEVLIISNLFLIFMNIFALWNTKRKKKVLEKKLIEIFEIVK